MTETGTTGVAGPPDGPTDVMGDGPELARGEPYVPTGRVPGPTGGASAVTSLALGFVALLGGGYVTFVVQWVASRLQEGMDAELAQRVNDIANASSGVVPALIALGLGLYARARARAPWVSAAGTAGILLAGYSVVVAVLSVAIALTETPGQTGIY